MQSWQWQLSMRSDHSFMSHSGVLEIYCLSHDILPSHQGIKLRCTKLIQNGHSYSTIQLQFDCNKIWSEVQFQRRLRADKIVTFDHCSLYCNFVDPILHSQKKGFFIACSVSMGSCKTVRPHMIESSAKVWFHSQVSMVGFVRKKLTQQQHPYRPQ